VGDGNASGFRTTIEDTGVEPTWGRYPMTLAMKDEVSRQGNNADSAATEVRGQGGGSRCNSIVNPWVALA
jgi:hypothetical protein